MLQIIILYEYSRYFKISKVYNILNVFVPHFDKETYQQLCEIYNHDFTLMISNFYKEQQIMNQRTHQLSIMIINK